MQFLVLQSRHNFVSCFTTHVSKTSILVHTQSSISRNPYLFRLFSSKNNNNAPNTKKLPLQDIDYTSELTKTVGGYNRPIINWYPGHIAKAESQLAETLKAVDIVVEVRDARAPKSTAHPRVAEWCGGKPRIVVCTKTDLIPKRNVNLWKRWTDLHGGFTWGKDESDYVDLQIRNKAMQIWKERKKYDDTIVKEPNSKKKRNRNNFNEDIPTKVEEVLFVDAKRGQGIHSIHRAIHRAGRHVNERRNRRGLSERALRVGVIGYPNVGKSALINRILGRKRARSSNTPGVTRSLQWIRVRSTGTSALTSSSANTSKKNKKEFELLDSPGIIPANMHDQQSDAMILAACNSIGTGAYDNQAVASYLMEWIKTLHIMKKEDLSAPQFREKCKERYHFDPLRPIQIENSFFDEDEDDESSQRLMTGEDMLFQVADNVCKGDPETAARKILQDFRTGRLGPISLQFAPEIDSDDSEEENYDVEKNMKRGVVDFAALVGNNDNTFRGEDLETRLKREQKEREERAKAAVDLAREKGLELPPMVSEDKSSGESTDNNDIEVGKGMFDGW